MTVKSTFSCVLLHISSLGSLSQLADQRLDGGCSSTKCGQVAALQETYNHHCSFIKSFLFHIHMTLLRIFFSLSHIFLWPASLWPWRSSSPDSRDGCPGPKKSSVTAILFAFWIGSVNSGHLLLLLQSLFGSLLFFPDVINQVKGFAQKNSP